MIWQPFYNVWLFNLFLLELYTELADYADSMPGTQEGVLLGRRWSGGRGRQGGADQRLWQLSSNRRLNLPAILFTNVQRFIWKIKWTSSMLGFPRRRIFRIAPYCISVKPGWGKGTWQGNNTGLEGGLLAVEKLLPSSNNRGCTDCKIISKLCSENVEHFVYIPPLLRRLHWRSYTTWSLNMKSSILMLLLSCWEILTTAICTLIYWE